MTDLFRATWESIAVSALLMTACSDSSVGSETVGIGGSLTTDSNLGGETNLVSGAARSGGAASTGTASHAQGGAAQASKGRGGAEGKGSGTEKTPVAALGGSTILSGQETTLSALGGATSGSSGTTATSAPAPSKYPCPGDPSKYDATMIKSGETWTVTSGGARKYSGTDTTLALNTAYSSLTANRTSKQSILVVGDGDIPATSRVNFPSYTLLNWCGTLNISGSASGDNSPFYARGQTDVEIANLKMTGAPSYGIFFRGTSRMVLGNIDLQLKGGAPGIGIRVDSSGSAGTDTTFVTSLTIDRVTGGGMSSQLVETYGVDGITIGTIEGTGVGECGLLLNRSINAKVDSVRCTNCGTGTGYAAFRVANSVGKIGNDWPADNIHVGSVYARGGGRGIFSVSGCGGLTIDKIDIANTGNTSILLQNTYNTTISAVSGTVVGGLVQISNDTDNTTSGRYAPSKNVAIKNLVLGGGASVRQDWCEEYGANGCTTTNVTGGTVSMCN